MYRSKLFFCVFSNILQGVIAGEVFLLLRRPCSWHQRWHPSTVRVIGIVCRTGERYGGVVRIGVLLHEKRNHCLSVRIMYLIFLLLFLYLFSKKMNYTANKFRTRIETWRLRKVTAMLKRLYSIIYASYLFEKQKDRKDNRAKMAIIAYPVNCALFWAE